MNKEIHFKVHRILLHAFVFALPFSTPSRIFPQGANILLNVTPMLLALFLLNWLLEADFKAKFRRLKENKLTFLFCVSALFYALYLVGMTYSSNLKFGKDDIFLKLPFLLFPLLFFTANPAAWKPKTAQNLLYTFALGNLLTLLISLVRSFFSCGETFSIECFHYANASLFFHSSYASMYYCFSLLIIFNLLINKQLCLWKRITAWFMFFVFPAEIVLLDSRTGLIAFAVVIMAFAGYMLVFDRKKILSFGFYMGLLAVIFTVAFSLLPQGTNRLLATIRQTQIEKIEEEGDEQQPTEKMSFENIDARAQVWFAAVEVIKENPVCGVGTGDVKDVLIEKYAKYDFDVPLRKRLNAHNQYLQVAVTLGVIGLAVFVVFLVYLFWLSWKKRNILLFLFVLLGMVNFWTESMFEKQIGVMFFAFFFALLSYIAANNLMEKEE